jgi:MFS family permease
VRDDGAVAVSDEHRTPETPRGVRAVLAAPGAARLIAASLVSAIPAGAISVLLILHVRHLGGSYGLAGLAAGAYTFGATVTGPLVGRLVDRRRIVPVLLGCLVLTAAAMTGLALLRASDPRWLIVALAVCGGLTHPPVGAVTRTLLPVVIRDEPTVHAAYALESSALELSYIAGPAVIAGLVATQSTQAALLVDAAVLTGGILWFVSQPAARAWRADPPAPDAVAPTRAGALSVPSVRLLLGVVTAFSLSFGAVEVAVAAAAGHLGHRSLTGPLLALWGLGSLVGGLVLAGRPAPAAAQRRLLWLLGALALGDALLVAVAGTWAFAVLLPLSGLGIAPAYAVANAMTGLGAVTGTSTEAFAWLGTGTSAGFSAGAALAGPAADAGGASAAFGVSLGGVALAIVLTLAGARLLTPATAGARQAWPDADARDPAPAAPAPGTLAP